MTQRRGILTSRRRTAFTLLELAAVMSIIVILSGVAVVSLSNLQATREKLVVAHLQGDLTYVRQRAMTTGIRTWIQFDTVGDTWTVLEEDPAAPGMAGASVADDPARSAPFVVDIDEDFPGADMTSAAFDGAAFVGFDWLGQPWSYNGVEAALAADGTVSFSGGGGVSVLAETGLITVP